MTDAASNTGKGFLPLDIAGVMNIGVEEWFDSYSEPVHTKFFHEIRDKLIRCFSENMPDKSAKPDLHQIWLANYKIVFLLSGYYFKYLMLAAARKQGYTGLVSREKMDFNTALELYRETTQYET